MKLTEKQENSQKMINSLIAKCWDSEDFKKELINNPEETIRNFGGSISLPDGMRIKVTDQMDTDFVHLNIPGKPNYDNMELSDEQLEVVAGGEVGLIVAGVALFAIGVYLGYNSK